MSHKLTAWMAGAAMLAGSTLAIFASFSAAGAANTSTNTPATITFGSASIAVNGLNTTRGTDQTILYSADYGPDTRTNQWGVELVVYQGVVQSFNDRQVPVQNTVPTPIPAKPAFVVSFHGNSADWARSNVKVMQTVTLKDSAGNATTWPGSAAPSPTGTAATPTAPASPSPSASHGGPTPTPTPTASTPPVTSGYPDKEIAGYQMLWSDDKDIMGNLPASVNVVRLAFFNDGGNLPGGQSPGLVGYGISGRSTLIAEGRAWLNAGGGHRIILSLGGGGYTVNLSNPTNVVNRIKAVVSDLSDSRGSLVSGIDWDLESSDFTDSAVFAVSQSLVQTYGSGFAITMVPNGTYVGTYLPTAKRLWQAGYLTRFGQQFYDAEMSQQAIEGRINEYLGTGMPIGLYDIGEMIGSDSQHPTEATWRTWTQNLVNEYPGLDSEYLWELSRAGTAQWAADMHTIDG